MKKSVCLLFAAVLAFGMAGVASASTSTWSSTNNPFNDTILPAGQGSTLSFTMSNLTPVTIPGGSNITSAVLTIVQDATSTPDPLYANFGTATTTSSANETGTWTKVGDEGWEDINGNWGHYYDYQATITLTSPSLGTDTLPSDSFAMTLINNCPAVPLDSATLTIDYTSTGGSQVPEPASLLLLGSGLVGLAAFRKRFKKA
ncbi:MAG: PEP-CTERM sorting domain-containing protein [Syntrophobacteraceae bacterium]|jgi:hypothetical protein